MTGDSELRIYYEISRLSCSLVNNAVFFDPGAEMKRQRKLRIWAVTTDASSGAIGQAINRR